MITIGIVIPVLNQFKLAIDAIRSIQTNHKYKLYIQPNWLNNRGVAGAWNDGIKEAFKDGCKYILVINDDIILSNWTIDNQILELENADDKGENLVLTTGWATTPPIHGEPISMMQYPRPSSEMAWVPGADFACFMMTEKCWEEVGEFDENFFPAYFEDNDYHRRILLKGLTAKTVPQAPYFHYGSSTQKTSDGVPSDKFLLNQQYYVKKWGGLPGAETFQSPHNNNG